MKTTLIDNCLTIEIEGRIDSNNASQIESDLAEITKAQSFERLVLDFRHLSYISSAGLRVVLKQKKMYPNFAVINTSPEVYDIFTSTGFSEIMTVEKVMREMSVDGCEIIGEGSNGIVYRYDGDTIIKVYRNPDCIDDIMHERELARKAFVLGINTAISYDVVKVGDSYGSVFEMLTAKSITKLIKESPDKMDEYVKITADLLKQIHATETEGLPDNKQIALEREKYLENYLEKDDYDKLVRLTAAIPDSGHMIHGDFHTNNVHYENGETLLIDMDTLSVGNPVFEFASVYLAYVGFSECDPTAIERFLKLDQATGRKIWEKTLRYYLDSEDPAVLQAASDKARVLGYMRLMRRTIKRIGKNDPLVEHCRNNLHELLQRVETLAY